MPRKKKQKKETDMAVPTPDNAMIPVSQIDPNPYNCNAMDKPEMEALISDMKNMKSPEELGYIRVRIKGDRYEIIDGEHRWAAAKKAKWDRIPALVYEMDQGDALLWNFRINRQRGSHDPMKEARFFNYLNVTGMNQKQIGEMLNIDPTTVSKRLSILKIDPGLIKPKRGEEQLPVSVLEVVAQVEDDKGLQREMIDDYRSGEAVEDLEWTLKQHKRELQKQKEFEKFLKGVKHRDCPKCGQPATGRDYWRDTVLKCDNGHSWFHKTGKDPDEVKPKKDGKPAQKQQQVIHGFRSTVTLDEVKVASRDAMKEVIKNMIDRSDSIRIKLKRHDWQNENSMEADSIRCHISLKSDQGQLSVSVEKKDYKTSEDKIRVDTGYGFGGLKQQQKLFNLLMKGELTFDKLKPKKKEKKKKGA